MGAFIIGSKNYKNCLNSIKGTSAMWMFLLILWSLFTSFYSPIPEYTFSAAFCYLSIFLFTHVLIQQVSIREILLTITFSISILIFASWLLYFFDFKISYFRSLSCNIQRFIGLAGSANNMGKLSSLLILISFLLYYLYQRQIINLFLSFVIGFLTLFFTWSRVSIFALFGSFCAFVFWKRKYLFFLFISFAVTLFVFFDLNIHKISNKIMHSISRTGDINEITTFTGRTKIWAFTFDSFLKSPLIGYGYGSTRYLLNTKKARQYGIYTTSAHNLFLQCMFDTGIIGLLFLSIALYKQAKLCLKYFYPLQYMIFIFIILTGFFESYLLGSTPPIEAIMLLISMFKIDSPG